MPQSRSRSQSPRYDEDSRSRYSHRTYDDNHSQRPRRREGGFRWKEKRRDDGEPRNENGVGLERGYRVRDRLRSPRRDRSKERCGNDREGSTKSEAAPQNEDVKERKIEKMEKKERKERKSKSKSSIPKEPMIVVNVNDRLGTKAAIPCLASDPIRELSSRRVANVF